MKSNFALTCCRSPIVLVYQLKVAAGSHSLTLAQRIDLGATLWDLTFDCKGNLWTLQAAEGSVARVHRAAADGEQLTVCINRLHCFRANVRKSKCVLYGHL